MNYLIRSLFLSLTLLFFASFIQADDTTENETVTNWTMQTLLDTFTINYSQTANDFAQVRTHYTLNAWSGITGFMSQYKDQINTNQMSIHPIFLSEPTIVKTGNYSGIHFFRVNQTLLLAELNIEVDLSLVILAATPNSKLPYIIQSMDILTKQK